MRKRLSHSGVALRRACHRLSAGYKACDPHRRMTRRNPGVRIALLIETDGAGGAERMVARLALRAAAMASGAFVSVSQALARQLSKDLLLPQRRITFIPNGVRLPTVEHSTLRAELGLSEEDQLLVSVGSLYPVKGHCYLVQA